MSRLVICRGISGSGKSTWARQQNGVVVERDEIRKMLFGTDGPDYYAVEKEVLSSREQTVTVVRDNMIAGLLKDGKDVYVSDTNIEWKFVKQIAKIGYRCGAEVEVKVFDVDLKTAVGRDEMRSYAGGRKVGRSVIERQHSRFQGTKNNLLEPVFAPREYNGTPGKPKAFLVDIDGTLAHMTNRSPYDWKRVGEDEVDTVISQIVDSLRFSEGNNYDATIIMSGRDESCRAETESWLEIHDIMYDRLFMRAAGDMRPDNIIKAELFDANVRDNYDVQFVLDDRDQVVDMWRRMGLTCLQVAPGDF